MEEVKNMSLNDVLEVITEFPIKPLGRRLIITLNMDESEDGLLLAESSFSESQYVVAVGGHITDFTPGAKVLLDLEKMMERVPSSENNYEYGTRIKIEPIEVNGKVYGFINENVVKGIDLR